MYGICSQGCVNTQGSYYCTCANRFRLKNDNSSCEVETGETGSTHPILLYAAKKSINMVHLRSGIQTTVIDKMVHQVIGLSSDGYFVYWTDVALNTESIVKARMDGTEIEVRNCDGFSMKYFQFSHFFRYTDFAQHWFIVARGHSYRLDHRKSLLFGCPAHAYRSLFTRL